MERYNTKKKIRMIETKIHKSDMMKGKGQMSCLYTKKLDDILRKVKGILNNEEVQYEEENEKDEEQK